MSAGGVITTVAGSGAQGFAGDGGPATAAAINNPRGVVSLCGWRLPHSGFEQPPSPEGFSKRNHHDRCGNGRAGVRRRQGPATSAQLSIPFGVAPTADGGFLIVDVGNQPHPQGLRRRRHHDGRRQRDRRLQRGWRACDCGEPGGTPQRGRHVRRRFPHRRRG